MASRLYLFTGSNSGLWRVTLQHARVGESLPMVTKLDVSSGGETKPISQTGWVIRGITSNDRYVSRMVKNQIVAEQLELAGPALTCAALIAIRKTPQWWALTQDERMYIFKEQSQHTHIGLQQFPSLPRRLHHCRDLSQDEPFDFITWFEFAPDEEDKFDTLLTRLRAIPEWQYVEREVEIRLVRDQA